MKKALVILAVALTLPVAAATDDKQPTGVQPGFDLAPTLTALAAADSGSHRVFADGTFDAMTVGEKWRFANNLTLASSQPSPEQRQSLLDTIEQTADNLEKTRSMMLPDEQAEFDRDMTAHALQYIRNHDAYLRNAARAEAGDPSSFITDMRARLADLTGDDGETPAKKPRTDASRG